ncbi:hypothetical protein [Archangium lipolyticum]|uniref:hypothetical protein n=1 Tax=Archangium lipolyticum TaxID=2970465 RepID=UPI002149F077|nr:hypothetical protein [Archangium lipolyticum]
MTIETAGIQFPTTPDGRRGSTATTKGIFAAALEAASPEAARAVRNEPRWRQEYPHHLRALTELSLERPENALATARAGLDAAWRAFELVRDGQARPLAEAMARPTQPGFRTVSIEGRDRAAPPRWWVPYRGGRLEGAALLARLDEWEKQGVLEPSHAEALRLVQQHPEWLDLSDRTFALLGAAAEAGPLRWLLHWRANVAAVDLKRPETWQRMVALTLEGNGRLLAPLAGTSAPAVDGDPNAWAPLAGADLLTETPEIAAWLASLGVDLDVASLAYLDGERHARVSMAMDAIGARWHVARAMAPALGAAARRGAGPRPPAILATLRSPSASAGPPRHAPHRPVCHHFTSGIWRVALVAQCTFPFPR